MEAACEKENSHAKLVFLQSYDFSGEPAQIAEIKPLASGAVTPLYRRATNEGIQLFLAGSAGLLQITENIRSEQCPGVTAAGRGALYRRKISRSPAGSHTCRTVYCWMSKTA